MKKVISALLAVALTTPLTVWGAPLPSIEIIQGASMSSSRGLPAIETVNGSSSNHLSHQHIAYMAHPSSPLSREQRGVMLVEEEKDAAEVATTTENGSNRVHARPALGSQSPAVVMQSDDSAQQQSLSENPTSRQKGIVNSLLRQASPSRLSLPGENRNKASWIRELKTGVPLRIDIDDDEVWVHISIEEQELVVMRGEQRQKAIDYVALGANGVSPVRKQGSRMTPEGDFRIDHINEQSKYLRFFRIDYPNPAVADRALLEGVIDQATRDYIHRYYAQNNSAPMDTPLGGHLGIHGLGNKDPYAHSRANWTDGCNAVTNEEIRALEPWLTIGTRVIIE